MNSPPSHWQDVIEPQFVRRLTRPLWQPGVTNNQLAKTILGRSDRLQNRLSLLTQQLQRWGQKPMLGEPVPIVYAQPASGENAITPTQPPASPQFTTPQFTTPQFTTPQFTTPQFATPQSSTLESASLAVVPAPPAVLPLAMSGQAGETVSTQSPDSSPVIPIVTPTAVSPASNPSGTTLLQAKLDTSQPLLPGVTNAAQSNASPHPRPIPSGVANPSIHSVESPQSLLESPAPVENSAAPVASSPLIQMSEQISGQSRDGLPNASLHDASAIPVVTPTAVSSIVETSGAMPLQAKLDSSTSVISDVTGHPSSSDPIVYVQPASGEEAIAPTQPPASPQFTTPQSSTLESASLAVVPEPLAVLPLAVSGQAGGTVSTQSPDSSSVIPIVAPNAFLPASSTPETTLLQAKLNTSQSSLPSVTNPAQSNSEPPSVSTGVPIRSRPVRSHVVEMADQGKTQFPDLALQNPSEIPGVTPDTISSTFASILNQSAIAPSASLAPPAPVSRASPAGTPFAIQNTAHSVNSLPLVAAAQIGRSQSLAPLVFSNSGVGGNGNGVSPSASPPQASAPDAKNELFKTQAIPIAEATSATYISPFVETQVSQTAGSSQSQAPDLEAIAARVERRLLRRLVIESERRGQNRWGLRN